MGTAEALLEAVSPSDPAVQLAAEKAVAALQQRSNSLYPLQLQAIRAASLQVLQERSWAAGPPEPKHLGAVPFSQSRACFADVVRDSELPQRPWPEHLGRAESLSLSIPEG